jgi:hypothetical protein
MHTRADRLSPAAAAWARDVVTDYAEDNATPLP